MAERLKAVRNPLRRFAFIDRVINEDVRFFASGPTSPPWINLLLT